MRLVTSSGDTIFPMRHASFLQFACCAFLSLPFSHFTWAADITYPPPQYLGEIRRNERGEIVAAPKREEVQPPVANPVPLQSVEPQASSDRIPTAPSTRAKTSAPPRALPTSVKADSGAPHDGILRVGPRQHYRSIAAASAAARNGDTVEIEAGDYIGDVAVWNQDRLTLRGVGGKVQLSAGGTSAQGKGIWVISGNNVTVENISFTGAKVADHNGAGIRFEKGKLTVRNCSFLNNENGILTNSDPRSELRIENSEFGHNGAGDGYSHNLYVGSIRRLTVTGSYFHHARVGHLLKTRAAENHIFYNRLTDETGGSASYELEFPNGGLAYVVGNIIQQSSSTQNSTIIAYGMEGYKWPRNEFYLSHNTIVDDYPKGGFFLRYQPGLQFLQATNNVLVGSGTLDGGLKRWGSDLAKELVAKGNETKASGTTAVVTEHNVTTDWASFVQASRFDYRLQAGALSKFQVTYVEAANGVDLTPVKEYVHPAGAGPLASRLLLPGAVQSRAAP